MHTLMQTTKVASPETLTPTGWRITDKGALPTIFMGAAPPLIWPAVRCTCIAAGPQKCGTTSMFAMLITVANLSGPLRIHKGDQSYFKKEPHWFNKQDERHEDKIVLRGGNVTAKGSQLKYLPTRTLAQTQCQA